MHQCLPIKAPLLNVVPAKAVVRHSGIHKSSITINSLKLLALLGAAAVVQPGQAADTQRSAEDVYRAVCHYCHESGPGPYLKARQLPATYVTYVVRQGQGAMPAFRPTEINDAELERLAADIENSKGDGQ